MLTGREPSSTRESPAPVACRTTSKTLATGVEVYKVGGRRECTEDRIGVNIIHAADHSHS